MIAMDLIMKVLFYFLIGAMGIMAVCTSILVLVLYLKHDIICYCIEHKKGSLQVIKRRWKFYKNKENKPKFRIWLKGEVQNYSISDMDHGALFLFKIAQQKYFPLKIHESEEMLKKSREIDDRWMIEKVKEGQEKYKNPGWWDKYGTVAMFMVSMVFILVAVIVLIDNIGEMSPAIDKMASAVKRLRKLQII